EYPQPLLLTPGGRRPVHRAGTTQQTVAIRARVQPPFEQPFCWSTWILHQGYDPALRKLLIEFFRHGVSIQLLWILPGGRNVQLATIWRQCHRSTRDPPAREHGVRLLHIDGSDTSLAAAGPGVADEDH